MRSLFAQDRLSAILKDSETLEKMFGVDAEEVNEEERVGARDGESEAGKLELDEKEVEEEENEWTALKEDNVEMLVDDVDAMEEEALVEDTLVVKDIMEEVALEEALVEEEATELDGCNKETESMLEWTIFSGG